MNILFLGDIVGASGCEAVKKHLPKKIKESKIDFVIANGE
nr:YmdB family metallophosphoesterase [Pelagibacterales bacterium]